MFFFFSSIWVIEIIFENCNLLLEDGVYLKCFYRNIVKYRINVKCFVIEFMFEKDIFFK